MDERAKEIVAKIEAVLHEYAAEIEVRDSNEPYGQHTAECILTINSPFHDGYDTEQPMVEVELPRHFS